MQHFYYMVAILSFDKNIRKLRIIMQLITDVTLLLINMGVPNTCNIYWVCHEKAI